MQKDREFARECWVVIWGLVGVVVEIVVVVVKMINYGVVRDIKGQICRRTGSLRSQVSGLVYEGLFNKV